MLFCRQQPQRYFNSHRIESGGPMPIAQLNDLVHFNSRPAWGAPSLSGIEVNEFAVFQFASPQGGRRISAQLEGKDNKISIRAPARGRREVAERGQAADHHFNSRPHTGGNGVIMMSLAQSG